jgi:CRISPR-associated protein Csd1
MLLQRLLEHGAAVGEAGPAMYAPTRIRYEVQLTQAGQFRNLVTLTGSDARGRDRGVERLAPTIVRTSAVKPKLLVDNAEYTLGIGRPDKAARYHDAFTELVRACADATGEPDVHAVYRYLERTPEERGPLPEEFEPGANVTFSVDGRLPIDLDSVRLFWARHADRAAGGSAKADTQCIVCGERKPAVDRYPIKIQGVLGAQGSGAALVTSNANAFNSYGLSESFVAPTCASCAERVCQTLNRLLADDSSRIRLSPLTYAFWTREPTSFEWGSMLAQPDAGQVSALLSAARTGRHAATSLDVNAFYCVALAPNSGRIAVRDWIDVTVPEAQEHLARYFELQRIVDRSGSEGRYFGVYALARATVRDGSRDDPSPLVPRSLMQTALRGSPLPDALLAQVVRRIQADGQLSHARAALIKMVLMSDEAMTGTDGWEDQMVELDDANRDPAYLCGRLLAVLDSVQRAALRNPNATIVDRFFGAAATAPVAVFGRLIQGAQPHLGKLRRDRPAVHAALDSRLQEILSGLDTFPRTLNVRQQGLFALGFYHQRAADSRAARERAAARHAAGEPIQDELDVPAE